MMHHHERTITERILDITEDRRENHRNDRPLPETNGTMDTATDEIIDELDEMDMSRDHPSGARYY